MDREFKLEPFSATIVAMVIAFCAFIMLLFSFTKPVRATEDARIDKQLLLNQSVIQTAVVSSSIDQSRCRETVVYVSWGAGTSAGAVAIETADSDAYAGTWAVLSTVNWTAASKEDVVQITGALRSLRTRISTAIVGGTVSTWVVCN